MMIPKEIVEKMEQVNKLMNEIDEWMFNNIDTDGSKHCHQHYDREGNNEYHHTDYYEFADKPQGTEQGNGEYCKQVAVGWAGDSFEGEYYYPTEDGRYFYYEYSV